MTPALLVCRKRCLRSALLRNTEILHISRFACMGPPTSSQPRPCPSCSSAEHRCSLTAPHAARGSQDAVKAPGCGCCHHIITVWIQNALKPRGMLCFGVWKSRMGNGWDAVRRQRKGGDSPSVPQAVGTPSPGAGQWQQEGSDPVVRSLSLPFASSPCSRRQKDEKKLLLNSTPKRNKLQGPTFWPAGWSQKVP